jgi:pilus assembly protein CpaB
MFMRNVLLAIGAVFVLAGVALVVLWSNQVRTPPAPVAVESPKAAVLVAGHAIQRGAELQPGDIASKEVAAGEIQPQTRLRGQEAEFVGKFSQRDIAEGEPLLVSDFISSSCLAALVDAGYRAVSIAVDAPQSVTGMAQRGDRVDVILTQTFDEKIAPDLGRRTVGETVLENVRVLATDQNMKACPNQPLMASAASGAVGPEGRLPKTVTLELKEAQAEKLMVAAKLGTFQLALRPLKNDASRRRSTKLRSRRNYRPNGEWAFVFIRACPQVLGISATKRLAFRLKQHSAKRSTKVPLTDIRRFVCPATDLS